MKTKTILLFILASLSLFVGCTNDKSPLVNEVHQVKPLGYQIKAAIFNQTLLWYDVEAAPNKTIEFPKGTYFLEAEDANFLYFKAPISPEYREYYDGKITNSGLKTGGLCLAKSGFSAYAYVLGDTPEEKILVWNLGNRFLKLEGSIWWLNYQSADRLFFWSSRK